MAQRDTTCTRKESRPNKLIQKQQPVSMKLRTSLSQPLPLHQQVSNSRRHLTLPVSLNHNYPQSPAERYILTRSRMVSNSSDQQDVSPDSPLSITASLARSSISSIQSPLNHAERMHTWRQSQTAEISKKQKHRYIYGPPPPSSVRAPTLFDVQYASPTYFTAPAEANAAEKNNKQSSHLDVPVKTDLVTVIKTERSRTNKTRMSTAV